MCRSPPREATSSPRKEGACETAHRRRVELRQHRSVARAIANGWTGRGGRADIIDAACRHGSRRARPPRSDGTYPQPRPPRADPARPHLRHGGGTVHLLRLLREGGGARPQAPRVPQGPSERKLPPCRAIWTCTVSGRDDARAVSLSPATACSPRRNRRCGTAPVGRGLARQSRLARWRSGIAPRLVGIDSACTGA